MALLTPSSAHVTLADHEPVLPVLDSTSNRIPPVIVIELRVTDISGTDRRHITFTYKRRDNTWTGDLFGTQPARVMAAAIEATWPRLMYAYSARRYTGREVVHHMYYNSELLGYGNGRRFRPAMDRMGDPTRHVATRGGHSYSEYQWSSMREMFSDKTLQAYVKASIQEPTLCTSDLVEHLNENYVDRSRFASALRHLCRNDSPDIQLCDCGHVEQMGEETTDGNGNTYCGQCAEDLVWVEEASEYYQRDSVYYWSSDGEYHLDEEPDEDDEAEEDNYSDLLTSWGSSTSHLAHDRTFTPSSYGDFTMGVELEVEVNDSDDRNDALDECNYHFNRDMQYAMFKRDGSLSETCGFEIVTAARKLGDHLKQFKSWVPHSELTAWNAGNCGMHVHIDSRAFTALSLGKFLQLYNDPANAQFIRAIAGRHPDRDSQAQSYAQRLDKPVSLNPASIKKGAGYSRYRMVNLTNLSYDEQARLKQEASRDCKGSYSTVEVRIFRASLKKERLLAQIEFAHATVQFCRVAGNHQLNGDGFKAWLATCAGQYKNLARWFGVYVPRVTKQRPAAVAVADEV